MKKTVFLAVALTFGAVALMAQADNVKKARRIATSGTPEYPADFPQAITAIDAALQDPSTKNLAETWFVKGLVYAEQFDAERYKVLSAPDVKVQAEAAYKAYEAWQVADSLDVIETANNPKSKGKLQFRKRIGDRLATMYLYMGIYGDEQFNLRNFAGAKKAYYALIDFPKSALITETSKKINPQDSAFYYANTNAETVLKIIYSEQESAQDTVAFLKTLEEGITRYPNSTYFLIQQIQFQLNSGNNKDALENMNKAIVQDPQNHVLFYARGVINASDKNFEAAKADFQKSIDLKPDYLDAFSGYGDALRDEADVHDNKSYELRNPAESEAEQKIATGLYKQAVDYYEKARAIDGKNSDVLYSLQNLYRKLKMFDKEKEIKAIREGQ